MISVLGERSLTRELAEIISSLALVSFGCSAHGRSRIASAPDWHWPVDPAPGFGAVNVNAEPNDPSKPLNPIPPEPDWP